jgi:hypothetical protein
VRVHCDRGKNGPLAAPFVTPVFVLHLVEARWRACSEIGNADSEVRAVDDDRRAASNRDDLLTHGVVCAALARWSWRSLGGGGFGPACLTINVGGFCW